MEQTIVEEHAQAPSALAFMARAFLPSPGLGASMPMLLERWSGARIGPADCDEFAALTDLRTRDGAAPIFPQAFAFRLQMALLTHRAFPLPLWSALQTRNRLLRHARLALDEPMTIETRVGDRRVVAKGVEIDLRTRLEQGGRCAWEGETTFLYRGRFAGVVTDPPAGSAPSLAGAREVERFRVPRGGGRRFGAITGDYNGIHLWGWYARRFGFRAAFAHPQRVAALALARLGTPAAERPSLALWIKGPVFYGAMVRLDALPTEHGVEFGIALEGETRHALVGRCSDVE